MFKILIVIKYKLKVLFADRSFLAAMIIIPIFLTLITGYALKFEKYDSIPIAICDLDNTDYSNKILEKIETKKGFKILKVKENEAIKLVKNYKAESAFIFKKGFKENIISGNIKGTIEQFAHPSSLSMEIIREIIGSEVARILLNVDAANWVIDEYINLNQLKPSEDVNRKKDIWDEAWQYTDSLWEPEPPMKLEFIDYPSDLIDIVEIGEDSFKDSTISSSAFGMLVAFIMFLIMFNSSWLIEERENGTLNRIISGPVAFNTVFIGNILSLLVIGIFQITLFSAICSIFFKIHIFMRLDNIVIIFIYLLSVIGISIFISSMLKTRIQLQAGAPLLSIITGFIGGCFWNLAEMGGIVRTISLFTPQGLALDLFRKNSQRASSSKSLLALMNFTLPNIPIYILLTLAVGLTLAGYISIRKAKY
jgi:ABC-2 type transport system permease protein